MPLFIGLSRVFMEFLESFRIFMTFLDYSRKFENLGKTVNENNFLCIIVIIFMVRPRS